MPQYGRLDLLVDLSATYTSPFDPDQIDLGADFTDPAGGVTHVYGFYGLPVPQPEWFIQFTPNMIGAWKYSVTLTTPSGDAKPVTGTFTVTKSDNPGFIRVSKHNPAAFAYDNGAAYAPVGEDMCWGGKQWWIDYERWLPKLQAAGGNWVRIWMWPHSFGIEGPGIPLGTYNLDTALSLDEVLDMAQDDHVYVMLTLGTYSEFTTGGFFHEGQWDKNPYNAANGGPCKTPDDFWTDPTARKLYKQYLRYVFARYGYHTGIMSWELWNETNAPADWVQDIGEYIKGTGPYTGHPADPYRHLLTTTYGTDAVWKLPEIDWTQTHFYGDSGNVWDLTPKVVDDAREFAKYGKPHQMSEFGIDWRKSDVAYDPDGKGVSLHNALWASAASGDAGGAMIWWWDSYIDPKNLYGQFTPLAKALATLDAGSGISRPLAFDPPTVTGGVETFGDADLRAGSGWGKAPVSEFTIGPDGEASSPGPNSSLPSGRAGVGLAPGTTTPSVVYPTYIYGLGKPDMRTIPTFHVDYPQAGQFIIHIDRVSSHATLDIDIDGAVAREIKLDAAPPTDPSVKPEYKSTTYQPEWKIYQALFDQDYTVDVPAGPHVITVQVVDGDWVSVDDYRLTRYRSSRYARLRIVGTQSGNNALIWVQNMDSNWKNAYDHVPVPTISGATVAMHGLHGPSFSVQWIDTTTGAPLGKPQVVKPWDGKKPVTLSIPDVATDTAAEVTPALPWR